MNGTQYMLTMRFTEESYPDLLDISALLYDLALAHDYGVLRSEQQHRSYDFPQSFWYRNGRFIDPHYRVKVAKITKSSPLELTLLIASVGALWVLLKIIEKVTNWPLNRKKLKLEMEKLELDVAAAKKMAANLRDEILADQVHQATLGRYANIEKRLVQRLEHSKLDLLDLEVKPFGKENPRRTND